MTRLGHSPQLIDSNCFNENQIEEACGSTYFLRGQKYWESGKVHRVQVDKIPGGLLITSTVKGSGYNLYQQSIDVVNLESDKIRITGFCSCPMYDNCKHVAAVLLAALKSGRARFDPHQQNPVDSWLNELERAGRIQDQSPVVSPPGHTGFCLLYILEPSSEPKNRMLQIQTKKTRRLKRGGMNKPTHYSLEQVFGYYIENFVTPLDKEIAQLLVTNRNQFYSQNRHQSLEGEFGELALKKLLSSGRCHWKDHEKPCLSLGVRRQIKFLWVKIPEGQQLKHTIDPPAIRIFHLYQLWYLDHKIPEIGPLDCGELGAEQVMALLDAPVIPEQQLEKVSRKLILDVPEYDLPTPVKLDIERIRIEGQEPVFHLKMQSIDQTHGIVKEKRIHCAHLSFQYGSALLEGFTDQSIAVVGIENTVFTIKRDIRSETGALDILRNFGLQPMNPSSTGIYESLDWLFYAESIAQSVMQWHDFIENGLPELRKQGWQITIDESFRLRIDEADEWHAELENESSEWFSLSLGVELDGIHINLLPTLVDILSQTGSPQQLRERLLNQTEFLVPVGEHRWLKLPSERLLPIFDTLVELYDHEPLDGEGRLELSFHQGIQIGDLLNDPELTWHGAEQLRKINNQLRDFEGIESVPPPENFNAELRPYQQEGLNWLQFLRGFEFNGILADDMGLGKTVQALAHLLMEKQTGRMRQPSLVIAPTSLMGNWRRETERFAPELNVLVLHGADRHDHFDQIGSNDVILTTYPLLRRDKERLLKHHFHYIILDESQFIKNPKSQTTRVVYELKASHRLCLTGTPMENHLGELWSMFHFLMPGFLNNLQQFNRLFRNPIERHGDAARQQQLSQRLKPFLLRRTKEQVAAELPEKTEIVRSIILQGKQRDLYETLRLAMDAKVREEIRKKGLARSHIMILDALLKLRQVCCDPRLLSLPQAKNVAQSAKLELLLEMVPEMVEEGRRILIFSQFTSMLSLIEAGLEKSKIDFTKLTGQTRKRDEAIARFQEGDVPVFLISIKAGGVGLNLTAADTVIHYDPWWNPAVENQATDRAHRIGQDKAVFVYKLISEETVEEKIIALQQKKQALADGIYSGKGKSKAGMFTADELTELLKPVGN